MKRSKLFSLKSLFTFMAILGIFWFSPESLYSQMAPAPSKPKQVTTQPSTNLPVEPKTEAQQRANVKSSAESDLREPFETFKRPSLITQAVALTLLSLAPFIIMILTSFLKIVVVLSLLRSALGVQQAPPNQIINGVAFMLSLFVMYPTATKMYEASQDAIHRLKAPESFTSPEASNYIIEVAGEVKKPLQDFLKMNSTVKHQALFYRMAYKGLPEEYRLTLKPDDFMILMPSYITSQLKEAFEIGVLIYIPFFVIDLVTSNILLAMGMMMLSPVTISMPLKLFLLVMLDGWTLLIEGLVNTFR
ncbi:MAG: type III secretion system export apparatus subunit SctR [Parachlamydiaceae bacterium]|nr:type III secretion system export apparatus subunit SctR [Parachlamydiaceae bacterium]